jgi:AmiR/NasT family two-component response regulator
MAEGRAAPLRVLLANELPEHLEHIALVVTRLGHTVTARETNIAAVAALTEDGVFDVAIVGVGQDAEHALDLIGRIVREANCPVIVILEVEDAAFVHQAAKRGVFAYIASNDATGVQLESSIDVVLHRFAEFHDLEGAFGRRALTERAKGVLMERHSIDEDVAFLMLRDQSRKTNRKLIDVAQSVLDARALLPEVPVDPPIDG